MPFLIMSWHPDGSPKDTRRITEANAAAFIRAGLGRDVITDAQIKREAELKQTAEKEDEELFGW